MQLIFKISLFKVTIARNRFLLQLLLIHSKSLYLIKPLNHQSEPAKEDMEPFSRFLIAMEMLPKQMLKRILKLMLKQQDLKAAQRTLVKVEELTWQSKLNTSLLSKVALLNT